MRRCFIRGETLLEGRIDWLAENRKYTDCYEKEAENCDAVILQHYVAYLKAYEKHLEEGRGEFGKMVEKIPQPPIS